MAVFGATQKRDTPPETDFGAEIVDTSCSVPSYLRDFLAPIAADLSDKGRAMQQCFSGERSNAVPLAQPFNRFATREGRTEGGTNEKRCDLKLDSSVFDRISDLEVSTIYSGRNGRNSLTTAL